MAAPGERVYMPWKALDALSADELLTHFRLTVPPAFYKLKPEVRKRAKRNYGLEYAAPGEPESTWQRSVLELPPVVLQGSKLQGLGRSYEVNDVGQNTYFMKFSAVFGEIEEANGFGREAADEAKAALLFAYRVGTVVFPEKVWEAESMDKDAPDTLRSQWVEDLINKKLEKSPDHFKAEKKAKKQFLEGVKDWVDRQPKPGPGDIVYPADEYWGAALVVSSYVFGPGSGNGPRSKKGEEWSPAGYEAAIVAMSNLDPPRAYKKPQYYTLQNGNWEKLQFYETKAVEIDADGRTLKSKRVVKTEPHPVLPGKFRPVVDNPAFCPLKPRAMVSLVVEPKYFSDSSHSSSKWWAPDTVISVFHLGTPKGYVAPTHAGSSAYNRFAQKVDTDAILAGSGGGDANDDPEADHARGLDSGAGSY